MPMRGTGGRSRWRRRVVSSCRCRRRRETAAPEMIREIVTIGHPVLREPTRPVTAEELAGPEMQQLIDDLIDTMRHANGAGIAANQIGEGVRITVIEVEHNPRYPYKPRIP